MEFILFGVFPYVAFIQAVVVGLYRYWSDPFSYSSFSSQFFENRKLFWGSVPWHYGILIILTGHLFAAWLPGTWATLFAKPVQLAIVEVTGLAFAFFAIIGIGLLILRRLANPRLWAITSRMDWVLLFDLLFQVASGIHIAFTYRWGMLWYLDTAAPWLGSMIRLNPQIDSLSTLPWIVKFHFFNAFVLISLFPFTRLIHIFTVPITYLWRPPELVIWNRRDRLGKAKIYDGRFRE